jgi:exodeoxyribonuclease VII large subunit
VAIAPPTQPTPRVSHLASAIQRALTSIGAGRVEGEVQKLRRAGSGHVYFNLADEDATIECCVWRSRAARIERWPAEGALVEVHFERVDFYGRSGRVSLHVDAIRLTGEGELLARKQATLERLTADGLLARARRPLPVFPRRVGVVAARDSDAKVDVIKALRERWPSVHIVHHPALVEGVRAVSSVIDALAQLQDVDSVDVIVLARGGGGVRDLVAFDDERLCRAVFACAVPVVTSIGHTAQRPNCDHVAAAYADVPARAAELVVPSAAELGAELGRHRAVLDGVSGGLREHGERLAAAWDRARPRHVLQGRLLELDRHDRRLEQVASAFYSEREQVLDDVRHRLARIRSRVPSPQHVTELSARLSLAVARARRSAADYGRAFARLDEQANRAFERRIRERDREVAGAAAEMSALARRRFERTQRSLAHVIELVEAKDFRRSGWVLTGGLDGRPVRSVAELVTGPGLTLHFHDGVADAAVTRVHLSEGEGHV